MKTNFRLLLAGLLLAVAPLHAATTPDAALAAANAKIAALTAQNLAITKADTKTRADLKAATSAFATLQNSAASFSSRLTLLATDLTPVVTPPVVTPPVVTPPVVTPPVADDASILAEVTDNTQAGVDKRLGPSAPQGMALPTLWVRPQAPTTDTGWGKPYMGNFSQGMFVATSAGGNFDFGSTDQNIAAAPDDDTTLGVYRVRSEEHSNGQVSIAPTQPWNGQSIPDAATANAVHDMGKALGRVVAVARGKIDRYDCGVVLYDEGHGGTGYAGMVGTETANPFWGQSLPAGKVPLCVALTSQNEFMLIGVHDRTTGKGQLLIYWMWAGNDLQNEQAVGFPADFQTAMPGLKNTGVITGMKLFATVDLPIAWPTSVDAVCSVGANSRIEGLDGNAAYLSSWDLSTQANRDAFMVLNGSWIADWAHAAVSSKYESKLVMVDLTPLVAGVKAQYFTDDAGYQQTRYVEPDKTHWYAAYSLTDPMQFPWGIEAKPSWAPVIGIPITLTARPNALLMSEHGDSEIVAAENDGALHFFKWDGTADGVLPVGVNPVHLSHDRYTGVRNGGPIVVCRGDRSVSVTSGWGPSSTIITKIQCSNVLDPVAAECGDTHNVSEREIVIADFGGKQVVSVRTTPYQLIQFGTIFGCGPDGTDAQEVGGVFALPAKPHGVSGSNVN